MRRANSSEWILPLLAATVGIVGCEEVFSVETADPPPTQTEFPPTSCSGIAPSGGTASTSQPMGLPAIQADESPPPISGGTLALSDDGKTLIAADPDRDAVFVVDVESRSLERTLQLQAADEPGRVVQDRDGRVHVALRGGRGIASFELGSDAAPRRSPVCDLPRGLAYDPTADKLFVACSEGVLVQVDPATGRPERKIALGRDLRDVVSSDGELLVTRFRSSEVLAIDPASGVVREVRVPASSVREQPVPSDKLSVDELCSGRGFRTEQVVSTPDIAWRTIAMPGGGVAMVHQRASKGEVRISEGGYGGSSDGKCGPGIVRGAVTVMHRDRQRSVDLQLPGLFVDLAYEPMTGTVALANPAGWSRQASVVTINTPARSASDTGPQPAEADCSFASGTFHTPGQVTAVTFIGPTLLAAQQREPAGLTFIDPLHAQPQVHVDFAQPTRYDTGHALFHQVTDAGLSCASCHAEAGDDGHVWTFEEIGSRRTQSLRGGILGTEPFHWNGDMHDFSMLVNEVFVGRMGGPPPSSIHADMLARWIDRQPVLRVTPEDAGAVERGRALFESEAVGCATCHTGPHFTNNQAADVGTGAVLQVPALQGIAFRAPFMHDGCAPQLRDRFGGCGGGDRHGRTSHLSPSQLDDLTAYLETL